MTGPARATLAALPVTALTPHSYSPPNSLKLPNPRPNAPVLPALLPPPGISRRINSTCLPNLLRRPASNIAGRPAVLSVPLRFHMDSEYSPPPCIKYCWSPRHRRCAVPPSRHAATPPPRRRAAATPPSHRRAAAPRGCYPGYVDGSLTIKSVSARLPSSVTGNHPRGDTSQRTPWCERAIPEGPQ